ncbi:hypothetical protein HJG60_009339 [Phyllostomus discolor]|uniref:Uncharacterized protein n=1 Tax=Phyllostomus discolor TaxID=89673 RepID=A0A834DCF0_9CHIR|nr:hypothetical protein HJG60_009339 [Phyllostomus discolor]
MIWPLPAPQPRPHPSPRLQPRFTLGGLAPVPHTCPARTHQRRLEVGTEGPAGWNCLLPDLCLCHFRSLLKSRPLRPTYLKDLTASLPDSLSLAYHPALFFSYTISLSKIIFMFLFFVFSYLDCQL